MARDCKVATHFFQPPDEISRFIATFLLVETTVDGEVTDYLHPGWGDLRFHSVPLIAVVNQAGARVSDTHFTATGPSAKALRFAVGSSRVWTVALLPLGWVRLLGVPAGAFADALMDGATHPFFAMFHPLLQNLFGPEPDREGELARLSAFFMDMLAKAPAASGMEEARIESIHAGLVDPSLGTVGELVARLGIGQRTLERVCKRAFGFPPKLLLRRQRLMRSLVHFLHDPSLKWIGALDSHYHDQAQFVREFHEFMGMTPSHYAAMDHPILREVVLERARFSGSAVLAAHRRDQMVEL
jgi:AraC-like DNA-binding protein